MLPYNVLLHLILVRS